MNKENLNLYQKLVEVRKSVPYLKKDTNGYRYKYVSGADVLKPIVEKMNELNLLLIPKTFDAEIEIDGDNRIVKTKMNMTWIDADNPDIKLEVPFLLFGEQNDISKAFGSGLTYSERYFLLKFFNIATDKDDPDAFQKKGENDKKNLPGIFKNLAAEELKVVLLESFPTENEKDKNAKKKLLNFIFNTNIWNDIIKKNNKILEAGTQKAKNILSNGNNIEILLGNQDGILSDPTEEPIADEGKIEKPPNEWKINFDRIGELKKYLPEPEYRSILNLTIPKKPFKKRNEIRKLEHQRKIIQVLETRVKELNPAE